MSIHEGEVPSSMLPYIIINSRKRKKELERQRERVKE